MQLNIKKQNKKTKTQNNPIKKEMGRRSKQIISPKKIYRWQKKKNRNKNKKHENMLNITNYFIYHKLKLQWGITLYQSEWPSSKSLQTKNAGDGLEKREHFYTVSGNLLVQPLWKAVWMFLKKLKMNYHMVPLLGIYSEKTIIQKDICTPMFTAARFIITKT